MAEEEVPPDAPRDNAELIEHLIAAIRARADWADSAVSYCAHGLPANSQVGCQQCEKHLQTIIDKAEEAKRLLGEIKPKESADDQ